MILDYTNDIEPREAEGLSDQEIADALNASGITNQPLESYALRRYLEDAGLLIQDTSGKWIGPIADTSIDPVTGNEAVDETVIAGLLTLFAQFRDSSPEASVINTTKPARGKQVADVIAVLVSLGDLEPSHIAEVYELAGGLKFVDVTAELVASTRAAALRALEVDSIIVATNQAISDVTIPLVAKQNAISAWLQVLDTSEMTTEQVQEYCDDLLGSADGNPTGPKNA